MQACMHRQQRYSPWRGRPDWSDAEKARRETKQNKKRRKKNVYNARTKQLRITYFNFKNNLLSSRRFNWRETLNLMKNNYSRTNNSAAVEARRSYVQSRNDNSNCAMAVKWQESVGKKAKSHQWVSVWKKWGQLRTRKKLCREFSCNLHEMQHFLCLVHVCCALSTQLLTHLFSFTFFCPLLFLPLLPPPLPELVRQLHFLCCVAPETWHWSSFFSPLMIHGSRCFVSGMMVVALVVAVGGWVGLLQFGVHAHGSGRDWSGAKLQLWCVFRRVKKHSLTRNDSIKRRWIDGRSDGSRAQDRRGKIIDSLAGRYVGAAVRLRASSTNRWHDGRHLSIVA